MKFSLSLPKISTLTIFITTLSLFFLFPAISPINYPFLPQKFAEKQLCQTAAQFTVKIISGEGWGTGILVQKQENIYTLVTNGHVLQDQTEKFIVETEDGQQYQASLLVNFYHGQITGNDLAILQFNSLKIYPIASLAKSEKVERVMAVGFPMDVNLTNSNNGGLTCTKLGEVSQYLAKPMQSGYQIGYKLTIFNGMSGGPLLNNHGQLVGIIGMGEPMIFVNPDIYLYKDGSRVTESLAVSPEEALDFLSGLSWAIPSETLVYLSPSGLKLNLVGAGSTLNYWSDMKSGKPAPNETADATLNYWSDMKSGKPAPNETADATLVRYTHRGQDARTTGLTRLKGCNRSLGRGMGRVYFIKCGYPLILMRNPPLQNL